MKILLSILTLSLLLSTKQKSHEKFNAEIIDWEVKNTSEYEGMYKFGTSEWESELVIIIDNNEYYGQIRTGAWKTVDDKLDWVYNFENLENVKIVGNKFYSNKTDGAFIKDEGNKALKLFNSWTEDGVEISSKRTIFSQWLNGEFVIASLKKQNLAELRKYTKSELQIMRNEIFARYFYKFKTGGEMDRHFSNQTWYKPQHNDVSKFLTEIEKYNIQLIQKVENE
jgi:hypothetical protein